MNTRPSANPSSLNARVFWRELRRAVTGSVIAGAIGTPLGALLGCASVTLLTGSFGGFTSEFGAGVGAVAGCGMGGLIGLTILSRCPQVRLRFALVTGVLAGTGVVPVVHNFAAYYLDTPDTAAANAWLAVRLLTLGVGSGCIEAGVLASILTCIRSRWEWMHRWDPHPE